MFMELRSTASDKIEDSSRGIRAAPRRGAVSSHRLAQASSARSARFCVGTVSWGGWGMWCDCCLCRAAGMLVGGAAKAMRGRRAGRGRIRWYGMEGPKGPGPELRARPDARASPARLVQPRVGPGRVLVVPPPAAPSRARPSPPALLIWPVSPPSPTERQLHGTYYSVIGTRQFS